MDTLCDLVPFYKALADETRLRLVMLLARQGSTDALCVGRLAGELGVTPSAVSQHLRVLRELGLVQRERRRLRIHYRLDLERLASYERLAQAAFGQEAVIERSDDVP